MLTINLNVPLLTLEGTEVPDTNQGKLLANLLISGSKGQAIKQYDWAMTLWKKGVLQVDKTDFDTVRALVDSAEQLTILAKAQILQRMDSQRMLHLNQNGNATEDRVRHDSNEVAIPERV